MKMFLDIAIKIACAALFCMTFAKVKGVLKSTFVIVALDCDFSFCESLLSKYLSTFHFPFINLRNLFYMYIHTCIKRLCSSNFAFENHMENLRGWFRNKGYPKNLVDNQLKRVIETSSISRCTRQRENGVPLVLTSS